MGNINLYFVILLMNIHQNRSVVRCVVESIVYKISNYLAHAIFIGLNERQVQAIADRVEERLKALGVRPLHVEGYRAGQWILLDYGDFLVHVFLDDRRRFYGLERLWSDAPDSTAEFVT